MICTEFPKSSNTQVKLKQKQQLKDQRKWLRAPYVVKPHCSSLLTVSLRLYYSHISGLIKVTLQMLFPFISRCFHPHPHPTPLYSWSLQRPDTAVFMHTLSTALWLHTSSKYSTSSFSHVQWDRWSERGRDRKRIWEGRRTGTSCEVTDISGLLLYIYG